VLLGGEATEQAVKSELRKASMAHFAMHYWVDESSEMLSGFPLASGGASSAGHGGRDGFLQSYEIYKMKLPRTRLVVLSGCQTGIEQQYSGEGAVGVARPFLVAGVPSVVASLWPIDSTASAELMINFHRLRRRDALAAPEALRRAQIEMARGRDAHYRHPFYWAPFVAIGGYVSPKEEGVE
jgi:CHAT domain-containing protein